MLDIVPINHGQQSPGDESALQQELAAFNRRRLRPGLPNETWQDDIARDARFLLIEGSFLERERAIVCDRAAGALTDADGFDAWLQLRSDRHLDLSKGS